jgi:hypothetical protein
MKYHSSAVALIVLSAATIHVSADRVLKDVVTTKVIKAHKFFLHLHHVRAEMPLS